MLLIVRRLPIREQTLALRTRDPPPSNIHQTPEFSCTSPMYGKRPNLCSLV